MSYMDNDVILKESDVQDIYSEDFTKTYHSILKIDKITLAAQCWLCFILSKQKYFSQQNWLDDEGYFYYPQKKITEIYPQISPNLQTEIIKFLKGGEYEIEVRDSTGKIERDESGAPIMKKKYRHPILSVKEDVGIPPRNYYKINYENLYKNIRESEFYTNGNHGKQHYITTPSNIIKPTPAWDILDINNKNNNKIYVENSKEFSNAEFSILQADSSSSSDSSNKETTNKETLDKETTNKEILTSRRVQPTKASLIKLQQQVIPQKESLPKKEYKISEVAKTVISFWNNSDLTQHRLNTKTAQTVSIMLKRIMEGTFFNSIKGFEKWRNIKFTERDITGSIKRFSLMATDPDFEPVEGSYKEHLRKLSLSAFLYNPYAKNDKDKSFFIFFINGRPDRATVSARPLEDPNPMVTTAFRNFYIKKVLGGCEPKNWKERDLNNFKIAAKKTLSFWERNKSRLADWAQWGGTLKLVGYVCEAVEHEIDKRHNDNWSSVSPGWFSSDTLFERTLPNYLNQQAMLKEAITHAYML